MAEETMFHEAVEALRRGEKARARELLTLLLKDEQTNATYWVWMSAAVESQKERLYCLQTAHKLDPENASAKRGLALMGALPPDENTPPFSLNRPRAWEQKLLLAHELPRPKGARALTSSPFGRLAGIGIGMLLLCGVLYFGLRLRPESAISLFPQFTAGPSPTFTTTPTLIGAEVEPTSTFMGPTPLWALLPATYTPTPFYISTQRQPQSSDQFRVARDAYRKGDWEFFITNMQEIGRLEPDSADVQYFIGEAHRFQGNAAAALASYNEALKINSEFGPAYLGLARARLMQDPNANVEDLFDLALQYDPGFGETYLVRADYFLHNNNAPAALADLGSARERMPDSPLVYYGLARAYALQGDLDLAVENAEKAYSLDITLLPLYLLRGELYLRQERYDDALQALRTYTTYETKDAHALALVGECYYRTGDYTEAIDFLTKALRLDAKERQAYLYRAFSYLETDQPEEALTDFDRAVPSSGETF
jgi:tetratricopeptide (TPR) repeat protein